jgi:hypothetical protein
MQDRLEFALSLRTPPSDGRHIGRSAPLGIPGQHAGLPNGLAPLAMASLSTMIAP